MYPKAFLYALFGASLFVSGCASSLNIGETTFACKEEGGCPTPIEVYEATHGSPSELLMGKTPKSWKSDPSQTVVRVSPRQGNDAAREARAAMGAERIKVDAQRTTVPLRSSSSILRIWIAPWIDENDRLNWARYTFVEVAPRTWRFGENEVRRQDDIPFVNVVPDADPGLVRR